MKTSKLFKSIALVLVLALLASAFAACAPKVGLEKVKKAGKLVVLTSSGFAPFEYLGANNEVVGVDMDIAQAVADEIGVKLEVVDMDFDGIVMAIKNGKGDLGAAGMTADDERRQSV
ncbi:MAG: transporter substrate-binding domain-containing protein, partial [Bacillota bacterium]